MTKPLSPSEIARLSVNLDEYFQPRRTVAGKHAEPYAKREEGRDRRNQRRQAIARKRSFLD